MEQFQIGCLLKMITDKIKMRADADLAQQGLTLTQSRVLGYLARNGGVLPGSRRICTPRSRRRSSRCCAR